MLAKTPSKRQNADADAAPFTIPFDKRQRQATTRMLITIVYHEYKVCDLVLKRFPCASHQCAPMT